MFFSGRIAWPSFDHVFGFGCDRFISILVFSLVVVSLNRSSTPTAAFIVCVITVAIVLVILLIYGNKAPVLKKARAFRHLISFCVLSVIIGIILQDISWISGSVNLTIFSVSVFLISIGSALLLLQWGSMFSAVGSKMMLVEVSAGYLVASVMIVPYSLMPPVVRGVYLILATIANGLLLRRSTRNSKPDEPVNVPNLPRKDRLLARVCVGLMFCGMGIGLSSIVFHFAENALFFHGSILRLTGGIIIMAAAICIAVFFRRGVVATVYRFTYLTVVFGTLLTLVIPHDSQINTVILFTGSTAIMIVGASILLNFAHRQLYHPVRVVSLGVVSIITGNLSVRCVFAWIAGFGDGLEISYSILVLLLTALFIIADSFFLTETTLLSLESDSHIMLHDDNHTEEIVRQTRVSRFEDDFGLTQREREVLRLLIAGRSSRRIQEELFISESTANTHIRHIYGKVGIHSRQELLDVLEDRHAL
jgi:DNA-binding CsgD family transcriptional regulator